MRQASRRIARLPASPTLAISARAKELAAAGRDVLNLSIGEPDFDTPAFICRAAGEALERGETRYTATDGTAELKQAIAAKLKRENDLAYESQEIIATSGAKQALFNACLAALNPGDEVLIPAPYWVSYPAQVQLAEAEPVILPCPAEQEFKLTPEALEQAITPHTRMLIINSPNNPSGAVYSRAELAALGEVLVRHENVLMVSDDIYEHLVYSALPFCNIVMATPALRERTLVVNGVSKAYAMTGWRLGYAAGPAWLIGAMKRLQSQSTSNPTSISQVAAQAALEGDQACVSNMLKAFKKRHDHVVERLNRIEGVSCLPAQGTFYAFPEISGLIERLPVRNDVELTRYLLEQVGVALVPGSAFGSPGYMRLSFATSMANLDEALDRLEKVK